MPLACFAQEAPITGTYDAVNGWGYMVVKRVNDEGLHKVSLVVGGGSCGGESMLSDATTTLSGGNLVFRRIEGGHACKTTISLAAGTATVSDSCIDPAAEEHSTCALMGEYEKRPN